MAIDRNTPLSTWISAGAACVADELDWYVDNDQFLIGYYHGMSDMLAVMFEADDHEIICELEKRAKVIHDRKRQED